MSLHTGIPGPESGPAGAISPDVARAKAKILIVDDDERNITALQLILEELGEDLVVARSGEEALRWIEGLRVAIERKVATPVGR